MGITPAEYEAQNWQQPVETSIYSDKEQDQDVKEAEPEQTKQSQKSSMDKGKFTSDDDKSEILGSIGLANGVVPPTSYGNKKLTKPKHSRVATHDSPLPNRHRAGASNVPLQRLPLNSVSSKRNVEKNTPQSQRLRNTHHSNITSRQY